MDFSSKYCKGIYFLILFVKAAYQQQAISKFKGVKSYTQVFNCERGSVPLTSMLLKGQLYILVLISYIYIFSAYNYIIYCKLYL